jgi:hypothetical protein
MKGETSAALLVDEALDHLNTDEPHHYCMQKLPQSLLYLLCVFELRFLHFAAHIANFAAAAMFSGITVGRAVEDFVAAFTQIAIQPCKKICGTWIHVPIYRLPAEQVLLELCQKLSHVQSPLDA